MTFCLSRPFVTVPLERLFQIPQTDRDHDRDDDIVLRFVTDPTDIDSKQMTFVHRKNVSARKREIAFQSLYKRNFTKPKGSV